MKELKFCPKCGTENLLWDGEKKWSCSACDYVLFHNCAAAVAVIIKCGEEILFTKRNQEPKKGLLDLPGGFVDPKESAEETCRREILEELKIDIDIENLKVIKTLPNIYHYKGIDYNTLDIFFEYNVKEKLNVQLEISEISEVVWLSQENLDLKKLAFDSQKRFFSLEY